MEEYGGLCFEPNLARMAMIRMRPRWAFRSAMLAGRLRWAVQKEPHELTIRSDWIRLQPMLSGICGSDMAVWFGKSSPYLAPLVSFPAVFGHEVVAQVVESRPGLDRGTRVVVDPTLGCGARGEDPLCAACADGRPSFCVNRQDPVQGPGILLGYHHKWPGGFASAMWAPSAQCWIVPDSLANERAVLTEPLATVLAGLDQLALPAAANVLIIGAGTIGLLATWACRRLMSPSNLHVIARHEHQAEWAKAFGAHMVSTDHEFNGRARDILGKPSRAGQFGAPTYYPGGYDVVIDAVGSSVTVRQGLSQTKPKGEFLLLGGAGEVRVDLTPLWSRGIHWLGSYGYGSRDGASCFPEALAWLASADVPIEGLVTHRYSLHDYRNALRALTDPKVPTIKVVLTQESETPPFG